MKFNLVAVVLGLLILATVLRAPVCESICRTSAPIYSGLSHSRILELLIVQVKVTTAPGVASGGLSSVVNKAPLEQCTVLCLDVDNHNNKFKLALQLCSPQGVSPCFLSSLCQGPIDKFCLWLTVMSTQLLINSAHTMPTHSVSIYSREEPSTSLSGENFNAACMPMFF